MSTNKTIGVIGLGSIGKRHAKNLLAMGHTVYAFDPAMNAGLRDGIQLGDNINWILSEVTNCDGFVIASPTKSHLRLIEGIDVTRPVFVEKPIARALDDEVAVMREELEAREGDVTMVGNNLRFHPCVKHAKRWLDEGLMGTPLWSSFVVAQHNSKYTDPVILNWGAHEIDLALYLLGSATVTSCVGNDRMVDVGLLHEGGVPVSIHMDYITHPECREFKIVGSVGQIHVDLVSGEAIFYDKDGDALIDEIANGDFDQSYKDEMQAFIDLIDGKPVPHAATGEDGLRTLQTILEAQKVMVAI